MPLSTLLNRGIRGSDSEWHLSFISTSTTAVLLVAIVLCEPFIALFADVIRLKVQESAGYRLPAVRAFLLDPPVTMFLLFHRCLHYCVV